MNRKRRLGRSGYAGILLSKLCSGLLTFDVAVQAYFNSGLACSQYFLFSVTIPGKTGEREETVMSAKTCGTVTRGREEIGQKLTGASPVTIPDTIAGRISAPVPLSSPK